MFTDITTARILVADRQARYRRQADLHRLGRVARRRRSGTVEPSPAGGGPGLAVVARLVPRSLPGRHRRAA